MTNKELDDYMKTVNPDFNSHIEKGTIEMSNEYYNLLEEKMVRLIAENQELNLELSGYRQAILNNKEMLGLKEENEKLKKQLEERTKMYQNAYNYSQKMETKAIILETQQKEFIKYLEDEIEACELTSDLIFNHNKKMKIYKEILQKYKSITGDDK